MRCGTVYKICNKKYKHTHSIATGLNVYMMCFAFAVARSTSSKSKRHPKTLTAQAKLLFETCFDDRFGIAVALRELFLPACAALIFPFNHRAEPRASRSLYLYMNIPQVVCCAQLLDHQQQQKKTTHQAMKI